MLLHYVVIFPLPNTAQLQVLLQPSRGSWIPLGIVHLAHTFTQEITIFLCVNLLLNKQLNLRSVPCTSTVVWVFILFLFCLRRIVVEALSILTTMCQFARLPQKVFDLTLIFCIVSVGCKVSLFEIRFFYQYMLCDNLTGGCNERDDKVT